MKAKRTLALLLAGLMLSTALVACSDDSAGNTDDTTASGDTTVADTTTEETTTVDPRLADELPEKEDFEGYEYTILTNLMPDSSVAWKIIEIEAESENGERINDAVYARNREFNERFNAKVVMYAPDNAPQTIAETAILSGDESFTVLQCNSQQQGTLTTKGLLTNMSNIKYLNFDKAWWDTDAIRQSEIGGKIYQAGGSATLGTLRATWGVFFNKDLAADAQLPDLYQTVRDGKWTLDLLKEYGKKLAKDVNGDGVWEYGVDTYGVAYQYEITLPLFQGYGAKLTEVDKNGNFTVVMDSPKAVDAMEKIYNFMNVDSGFMLNNDNETIANKWVEMRARFMEGQIGFYMGHLSTPVLIPDMQSDFGILPFPKLDDTQEEYASAYQYNNYMSLSVPKTTSNFDRTGLLTEGYVMLSHDTVREAWYDYTLTLRSARDNESGEMLDIIFGARGFDLAFMYNGTTSAQSTLQNVMKESAFTYASTVASAKATLKTKMQTVIDAIMDLDI